MTDITKLADQVRERFQDRLQSSQVDVGELALEIAPEHLLEVCRALRDEAPFAFEMLIDVCGVDYLDFGRSEWETAGASARGFSRGVAEGEAGRLGAVQADLSVEQPTRAERRFAAVYHLLSLSNNQRIRLRCFAPAEGLPVIPSVTGIWNSAEWYEREAFDLYGIVFEGHADLRRLLTDYGFIGHPFRKDFPLSGNVEVRYDPEKQRVVYQPVSIEPRVLVPKVVRDEARRNAVPVTEEGEPIDESGEG